MKFFAIPLLIGSMLFTTCKPSGQRLPICTGIGFSVGLLLASQIDDGSDYAGRVGELQKATIITITTLLGIICDLAKEQK